MRCDRHNVRFKTVVSNSKSKHTQFSTTFLRQCTSSSIACLPRLLLALYAYSSHCDTAMCRCTNASEWVCVCACMYCTVYVLCLPPLTTQHSHSHSQYMCVYASAASTHCCQCWVWVCVFFFRHDSFSLVCARAHARDSRLVSAHRFLLCLREYIRNANRMQQQQQQQSSRYYIHITLTHTVEMCYALALQIFRMANWPNSELIINSFPFDLFPLSALLIHL